MTGPGVHSAFAAEWPMFVGGSVAPADLVVVGGITGCVGGSGVDGVASEGTENRAAVSVSLSHRPAGLWR